MGGGEGTERESFIILEELEISRQGLLPHLAVEDAR